MKPVDDQKAPSSTVPKKSRKKPLTRPALLNIALINQSKKSYIKRPQYIRTKNSDQKKYYYTPLFLQTPEPDDEKTYTNAGGVGNPPNTDITEPSPNTAHPRVINDDSDTPKTPCMYTALATCIIA